VLAKRTGLPVVANFRAGDLALGGQGAPLVPYVDYLLFHNPSRSRALLNIGGIANVTVLPKNAPKSQVFAFDTGPGNMVLDALAKELFGVPFDEDGKLAARGTPSRELLTELLQDPYFERTPPKSTGRDYFGSSFLKRLFRTQKKFHLNKFDLLATVAELTVESVVLANERWIAPKVSVEEWILSGGGARNPYLCAGLEKKLAPAQVLISDELGLSADAKEAVAFAILANEFAAGNPANLPAVTGAVSETILGALALP
jgi:anhydro-N-acetylmuramic acid kinase